MTSLRSLPISERQWLIFALAMLDAGLAGR
jgi:hypothetical protein